MDEDKIRIETAIAQANQRLQRENIGLKISRRGHRLYLRGSLPPKAHSKHEKPHQQDIALGYRANSAGITAAYKQAKLVEAQVINRVFDWQDYQRRDLNKVAPLTFQDWILKFEEDFRGFSQSKDKEMRWRLIYSVLHKLPLQKTFTPQELEKEFVKIIEACSSAASKISTRKIIKQFTQFLQREGVEV